LARENPAERGDLSTVQLNAGVTSILRLFVVAISAATGLLLLALTTNTGTGRLLGMSIVLGAVVVLMSGILMRNPVRHEDRRPVPWWLWLWTLLFFSALVFRIRDTETILDDPIDGWVIYRVAVVAFVACVLLTRLALDRRVFGPPYPGAPLRWLLLYGGISLASTVWSVQPYWTFYKAIEYLVGLALAVAIVATVNAPRQLKQLLDWTWALSACLGASVVLGALLWPDVAIRNGVGVLGVQLIGVVPAVAANGVGDIGAILGCVAATRLMLGTSRKGTYMLGLVAALVLLALSQSRAPTIGLFAGIGCVLFLSRRRGWLVWTTVGAAAVLMLSPLGQVAWDIFLRGQTPDLIRTLSGRTTLWSVSWEVIRDRPILGHGSMAATRFLVAPERPWGDAILSGADNTYIEVLSGVGVVGLAPLLVCLLATWRQLARASGPENGDRRLALEAAGVFSILTVRSFFTSGTFIWHPNLLFLAIVASAEIVGRRVHEAVTRGDDVTTRPARTEETGTTQIGARSWGEAPQHESVS
jgi:O-antigen ligase